MNLEAEIWLRLWDLFEEDCHTVIMGEICCYPARFFSWEVLMHACHRMERECVVSDRSDVLLSVGPIIMRTPINNFIDDLIRYGDILLKK